jgi:hypothetical protein
VRWGATPSARCNCLPTVAGLRLGYSDSHMKAVLGQKVMRELSQVWDR